MNTDESEVNESKKSAAAMRIARLPKTDTAKPLIPPPELVPATTSTTLAKIIQPTVPSTVPTTTTTMPKPAHSTLLDGDKSGSRTSAQSLSYDERCQKAITNGDVSLAPGYHYVCGPEYMYETDTDGDMCPLESEADPTGAFVCAADALPGEVRVHPDYADSDAAWEDDAEHEAGHTRCISENRDYSEICADAWANTH